MIFRRAIILSILFMIIIQGTAYSADPSMLREFSKDIANPGDVITVDINIINEDNGPLYLIEEYIPPGFEIIDPINNSGNVLRWHYMNNNTFMDKYTYTVKLPQKTGLFAFAGNYWIDGMQDDQIIGGKNSIKIISIYEISTENSNNDKSSKTNIVTSEVIKEDNIISNVNNPKSESNFSLETAKNIKNAMMNENENKNLENENYSETFPIKRTSNKIKISSLILAAMLLTVLFLYRPRNYKKTKSKEINIIIAFFNKAKQAGVSIEMAENMLLEKGWKKEIIDKAIKIYHMK